MDMILSLDTAEISEIEEAASWGVLGSVTTNPTLISKAGHANPEVAIKKISSIIDGPVSMECVSTDADGMYKEGLVYHSWAPNVLVKCPCTPAGLAATHRLSREGIKVNMTLIFSPNQAILSAKAGAWCCSPFAGRLDDISWDGLALVAEICEIFRVQEYTTKVLAASLRHPVHVMDAARVGADIATMPFKLFKMLVQHPLTVTGLEQFMADWQHLQEATAAK
ncbi:MAG: transaldolase [Actinobacteria bacterium]|nr:transaldolase [Actinomycetota bacterium]